MRRLTSVLLLTFLAAAPAVPSDDDREAEARKLLTVVRRGDDPREWREAVLALRALGGDAAAQLDRTLGDLLAAWRRRRDRARDSVVALATRVEKNRPSDKAIAAWDRARGHAREWLFNRKEFPDIDGAIFGPQEGYDEAMKRAREAIRTHAALTSRLDRAIGRLPSPKTARALLDELRDAARAIDRISGEIPGAVADDPPDIPPLARLLLDVAVGDHARAAERYRALPAGWSKLCAFEAYGRSLQARNARTMTGKSARGKKALEGLNRYRMALGASPLVHHDRLWRMATDHSREMSRLGYFSHESPTWGNHTKEDRAEKAGYEASVAECISARTDPKTAIDVWKWDGGHHRVMIRPSYIEAGLGTAGPCVLDVGSGDKKALPGIRYR